MIALLVLFWFLFGCCFGPVWCLEGRSQARAHLVPGARGLTVGYHGSRQESVEGTVVVVATGNGSPHTHVAVMPVVKTEPWRRLTYAPTSGAKEQVSCC